MAGRMWLTCQQKARPVGPEHLQVPGCLAVKTLVENERDALYQTRPVHWCLAGYWPLRMLKPHGISAAGGPAWRPARAADPQRMAPAETAPADVAMALARAGACAKTVAPSGGRLTAARESVRWLVSPGLVAEREAT